MTEKQVKQTIKNYGFTPEEQEVKKITDSLENLQLSELEKIGILHQYCKEAVIGFLFNLTQVGVKEHENPKKEGQRCPECNVGTFMLFLDENGMEKYQCNYSGCPTNMGI
jgi:hypothetical protein